MVASNCWRRSILTRASTLFSVNKQSPWLQGHCWKDISLYDASWGRSASYSTITPAPPGWETVEITCRSNASITLNILPPDRGPKFDRTILYLPAGPVLDKLDTPAVDSAILTALSATSNATIVRVNYRAGRSSPYPIPIHDVLAGYDWTLNRMAEDDVASRGTDRRSIGVAGSLLGGSLASMLALTESRLGHPRIVAAAVNNPIVDWVESDREELRESLSYEERAVIEKENEVETNKIPVKSKKGGEPEKKVSSWREFSTSMLLPVRTMLQARNNLFQNEDSFFDRFASPIHFFRTPGIGVPEDLKSLPYDPDEGPPTPTLLRKSRRVYPPSGSNIVLPRMRLSCGEFSILRSQNEELIERLNTSEIKRQLKILGIRLDQYKHLPKDQRNEVDFIRDEAKKMFQFWLLREVGLWGLGHESDWREDVESAGTWLREVLES